ncbi:MAG TPA: hypothetical protein VM802_02770 [Chitinophaga sp.]|uniref:hypothetical protein n=1 Tax=Chitinophaga sp. TaxID=1869181 RepID=UPI002CACD5CF|nr:hypothetical protein [Chitinophaga sp.]HVI43760.1 hypothetical protein [Chitinophaga sp.]
MKVLLFLSCLVALIIINPDTSVAKPHTNIFGSGPLFRIPTLYNITMLYNTVNMRLSIAWHSNPGTVMSGYFWIQVGSTNKEILWGDNFVEVDMSMNPIQPNVVQTMYFNKAAVKYVWNGATVTVTCQPLSGVGGGCETI